MTSRRPFLAGVSHPARAVFFMVGVLVFYGFWLWLLMALGMVNSASASAFVAALLLAPLLPVAAFDIWLRLTWQPEMPTLYPPPPGLRQRLLEREYGLYWFPALICIPLWLWGGGLIGWIVFAWSRS